MTEPDRPEIPGVERLELIGRGGYGTVWRGVQPAEQRVVAVKILAARAKGESRRAFEAETRAIRDLQPHRHVVELYDAGTTRDGEPYLVMELCERSYGAVLTERLVHGESPFAAAEVAEVGRKVADALATVHALGIVHGDVTPDNVLRTVDGEPVLADFGQAVRQSDRERKVSGLNLSHVAPEVIRTARAEPASDVYGLGSTLYTLLTGHPPFPFRAGDSAVRHQHRILNETPAPLPEAHVPAVLADAIDAMLRKDPGTRPDASWVRDALDTDLGNIAPVPPPRTMTVPHDGAIEVDREVEDDGAPPAPPAEPPPRRWPVAVGIVTGLAVAAALVTVAVRSGTPEPVANPTASVATTPVPTTVAASPSLRGAFYLSVKDNGRTAELSWTPYRGATYYLPGRLRTAPRRGGDSDPLGPVRAPRTNAVIPIDPAAKYCFQVAAFGRAGGDPPRSNVVAIRGARCPAEV
ncbi:MAG TPA: serine/threonine-protein kinase [Frankiaceae bacterium]|nr:serine/threonine-protein kinase [Frankiaceae bacterium]